VPNLPIGASVPIYAMPTIIKCRQQSMSVVELCGPHLRH